MTNEPRGRTLAAGQRCLLHIVDLSGAVQTIWHADDLLLEAPNWTEDGRALILNGDGDLWRLDIETAALSRIPISGVPPLNNDHVLAPGGDFVFVSAGDGQLYRAPLKGGEARVVTARGEGDESFTHYLHGVSPDGDELAFVGVEEVGQGSFVVDIFTIPAQGGSRRKWTDGSVPVDGCEYSPDGDWIYFNTEQFDGHAQLARMRRDGSAVEQLTRDERVNWFPHLSPDGRQTAYLSYPSGTRGHPADVEVELHLVSDDGWDAPRTVAELFGGQGTINVNSWAPSSDRFAFVSYPMP
jgi:TolB protein